MENEFNVNELVEIKQMPIIYQQLDLIGDKLNIELKNIDDTLANFSKLSEEEQEEQKQDIKKYKTYINSISKQLEDKRKEIKKKINEPYEEFNKYYDEKVKCLLDNGVLKLTTTINEIESKQLEKKTEELERFFGEYVRTYHLETIVTDLKQLPIKINISSSEKSLKEAIKENLNKINNEVMAIEGSEDAESILVEYKNNGFDYANACIAVNRRKEQLRIVQENKQQMMQEKEQEQIVIENVNTLCSAPIEEVEEELLEITFKVTATKTKLLELKAWLKENNITYE